MILQHRTVNLILLLATTVSSSINAEACIDAAPSYPYAVKNQEGNVITLETDENGNKVYKVLEGTTLTFEVSALIAPESEDSELLCEWYNSFIPNADKPIAVLSWWWWTSSGKNSAAPPQAPDQTNTPMAPENIIANTRKGGLYAFRQTFDRVTPKGAPITIAASLYANEPSEVPCPAQEVKFLVQVDGPPDTTSPDIIPQPENNEITVSISDRILLKLNTTDPEDNLEAIEWYVEGFGQPLRSNGVNTLNTFLYSPNEDHFAYRFKETGRFNITVLSYDNFENGNTFTWQIDVQEPLLTRSSPHAAETSVQPSTTKTFKVLADIQNVAIDGVCWQNDEGALVYIPIAEATSQGDFLAFEWDTSFAFETIGNFFATAQVTATGYTENASGEKALTGNTVTWVVRTERHIDNSRSITFSGLDWKIKQSNPLETVTAPGNNYFYSENVSVDAEGLHLKITQNGDIWTCAELFTVNSMPRGIYRFYLEGGSGTRLDQLDPQVTFSPFFYSDDTREIDIEFSNWSASDSFGAGQFQYVIQPFGIESLNRFELDLDDPADTLGKITCQIDWQDDRIIFKSWLGHSASPPDANALLSETWTYEKNLIPESGDELKLHINLYLKDISNQDNKPENELPAHVIVRAIDHPASWEGWRVENFGERQALPDSIISKAQDDPDTDNCTNLLEYALGKDPWKSDPNQHPRLSTYQEPDSQEDYLDYTFARRKASPHPLSENPGSIHHTPILDYYIKSKADLADTETDWINEPMRLIGDPNDLFDGTETVTYRTEATTDEVPQKSFQLQVEMRDPPQ